MFIIQNTLTAVYENKGFNFPLSSEKEYGITQYSVEWDFMFGCDWPNDKEQTIKRVQYVIDNGSPTLDYLEDDFKRYAYLL